jgi:bifunctional DNA-binding transcriptional regulator/antitoxin component of YhaV-PrlF toxin-antitoxin module
MARSKNIFLHNVRGQIGKEIVVKKYGKKTVVTKYPDMSKVKPSKLQKVKRSKFAEAVANAQNILRTPALKAQYAKKVKRRQTVYNYAIKEYMKRP